jgi:hypothetical protein
MPTGGVRRLQWFEVTLVPLVGEAMGRATLKPRSPPVLRAHQGGCEREYESGEHQQAM